MTVHRPTAVHERVRNLITRYPSTFHLGEVESIALELFEWQISRNLPWAKIVESTLGARRPTRIDEIPAVPTDAFKVASIACFDPQGAERVFRTSGTTLEVRGVHAMADTSLYTLAAIHTATLRLLPGSSYQTVFLAQNEHDAPDSSLSFMLGRFAEKWDPTNLEPFCVRHGVLDASAALAAIRHAIRDDVPVALLGPSFGFVHLMDAMASDRVTLPANSVAMPTGGFKGRSRELRPDELRSRISERFGLDTRQVIGEYGMTELSSQAYESVSEDGAREYISPGWMHVTAVDPASLERVPDGELGLLRIVDLANVWSAIAIQTSDVGRVSPTGFQVIGRAVDATPRGCARALDLMLSKT